MGITVALAAVAALTLGACGSDKAADTSTPAAGSETSAAADTSAADTSAAGGDSSAADTSAAGGGDAAASQLLTNAKAGKLTIGVKFDQPGLGQKNPDGSFSGFDIDVARYVAKELGVDEAKINFVETKSAEREDKIAKGEVDYIVGTYSITDTRKEKVNFAGPYFLAHQDLLVKADNTDITGPETLNGKILCSVTGSTSAQKVKDQFATEVALQEFGTYSECAAQVKAGVVDALTTDDVILAGYAAQDPGVFRLVGKGFSDENYGIGLKKGDTTGEDAINTALKKMVSDGSWKASLEKNVGPSGYTIPDPPENLTS
nr:glutamate ABC transporter substrate-binding protein [Nakamurella lactea]